MGTALSLLMYWCHVTGQRMVRWRLQQEGSWGSLNEGQQGKQNSSVSRCDNLQAMGESFQQQSAFISSQANSRWTDSEKFTERLLACFLLTLKSQMWVRHLQGVHLHHLLCKKCSVSLHSLNPYFYFCLSVLLYLLLALLKAFKTPPLHMFLHPIHCFHVAQTSLLFLVVGRRLPRPTQLSPECPAAVHTCRALPAEGLQRSRSFPGGDTRLRPRKRGQEERGGEGAAGRRRQKEEDSGRDAGFLIW